MVLAVAAGVGLLLVRVMTPGGPPETKATQAVDAKAPAPKPAAVRAPAQAPSAVQSIVVMRAPLPPRTPLVPGGHETDRPPPAAPADRPNRDAIPGEFVLGFYSDADRAAFMALAARRGAEILGRLELGHAVRVRVKDRAQLDSLLREGPTPTGMSTNYRVRVPPLPEGASEAYRAFDRATLRLLGVSGEEAAGGRGAVVAVLDTPVYSDVLQRPESITQVDFMGYAMEEGQRSGHGTAVASIIAGAAGGVAGVAPAASLLSLPVMAADGTGDTYTVAKGIVEAVNRGAAVVNLCLGSQGDCFLLEEAVRYAQERGVVVVASVGNDGVEGVRYPAAYEGAVAVSAVDASEQTLSFANRGEAVDIAAPGLDVAAAGLDGGVIGFSGTSAATPFVSGAIAALMSREPGLTAAEAVKILEACADDAGPPGKDDLVGNGVLNLARAEERTTGGILDAAVAAPYVREAQGGVTNLEVMLFVQNRGTERLPLVTLDTNVGGQASRQEFRDMGVGESAGRAFPLDARKLREKDGLTVTAVARLVGRTDAHPENNEVRAVLSAPAEATR
jgi:hypothetical protein